MDKLFITYPPQLLTKSHRKNQLITAGFFVDESTLVDVILLGVALRNGNFDVSRIQSRTIAQSAGPSENLPMPTGAATAIKAMAPRTEANLYLCASAQRAFPSILLFIHVVFLLCVVLERQEPSVTKNCYINIIALISPIVNFYQYP